VRSYQRPASAAANKPGAITKGRAEMKHNPELPKRGVQDQSSNTGAKPRKDKRAYDVDLEKAAVEAIECLTTVPMETVQVTAHDGLLRLEGTVSGEHQRILLEDVTRHLPGVRQVIDSITIKPV